MSDGNILPYLSDFDPPETAEGSLDPLGLYAIADALAVRLAPGVRERQVHPRYLTLALVGQITTAELRYGTAKGLPPWLAYEWVAVRCIVQQLKEAGELQGVPGSLKVTRALQTGLPICAETYLKTPTVFGFHGIYRVLGTKTGLFDVSGVPLAAGFEVLEEWEKDQDLAGFLKGDGPGKRMRIELTKYVRQAIEREQCQDVGQEMRQFIARHLHPLKPGTREAKSLWRTLQGVASTRREYIERLTSPRGQEAWHSAVASESTFQRWMADEADASLRRLLATIRAYEQFARCVTDAFSELRHRLTAHKAAATAEWLAGGDCVADAHRTLPQLYREALNSLREFDAELAMRFERAYAWAEDKYEPPALVDTLLKHHHHTQRSKPPNGKRSWFDLYGDKRVDIRPAYRLEEFEAAPAEFVHGYRTKPLWNFALDLGVVQPLVIEMAP